MTNNYNVNFCSRTHKGKVRRINEDALVFDKDLAVGIVADGIGGKDYGEVASKIAVDSSLNYLQDSVICQNRDNQNVMNQSVTSQNNETSEKDIIRELTNAVKVANESIITVQRNKPKYSNMGSTIACFKLNKSHLYYSWVGDSRVYLLKPKQEIIRCLTKDHTLDQSKIDPKISPSLYRRAPNILTQMVGSILLLKPDNGSTHISVGDIVLVCSDGLSDRIPDELILEYTLKFNDNTVSGMEALADKLLDRALDCGGQDNISFILAQTSQA